jgi:hypothetical protein
MRGVTLRFLVGYAVAFAMLWGIGVFLETRSINPNAARFPWEGRVKISHHWPLIEVYVLEGAGGAPTEYVVINDMRDDNPPYPDSNSSTEERTLGVVYVWWQSHLSVAAPFVTKEESYVKGGYDHFEDRMIPTDALEEAKTIAYHAALRWFDTQFYEFEQLKFRTPDMPFDTDVASVFGGREYYPAMPWWFLIALFSLVPFVPAWFMAVTPIRDKSGAS